MYKNIFILSIGILLICSALARAKDAPMKGKEIDTWLKSELKKPISVQEKINRAEIAYQKWDDKLNYCYKNIMYLLTHKLKPGKEVQGYKKEYAEETLPLLIPQLKDAQRAWLQFRDLEFAFAKELYAADTNEKNMLAYYLLKIKIVRDRTCSLLNYTSLINEIISELFLDEESGSDNSVEDDEYYYNENNELYPANKDDKHPIDTWIEKELEKDGTTLGQCSALWEATEKWDTELNASYRRLMNKLGTQEAQKLKEAERAWIKFKDSDITFMGSIYSLKDGTLYKVSHSGDVMNITQSRALELLAYEKAEPVVEVEAPATKEEPARMESKTKESSISPSPDKPEKKEKQTPSTGIAVILLAISAAIAGVLLAIVAYKHFASRK